VDHHTQDQHESLRGAKTWGPMIEGLNWLSAHNFPLAVAGRTLWNESEAEARQGYARMFEEGSIRLDAQDPMQLVLFPEMDETVDVPEVTTACECPS